MPSTVIRRMEYDAEEQVLEVEFTSGSVYEYLGVPRAVYEGFKASRVRGRYFVHHLRDNFPHPRKSTEGLH
ncbi:MAG: KTSC domain-containing protein [Rhodospirillaceae bacterium]